MQVATDLRVPPTFELACLYDDPSKPAELAIYSPEAPDFATEWLTADRSTAVSLDSVR